MKRYLGIEQLEQYRNYLQQEEHSEGTIDKYLRDIRQFMIWLHGEPIDRSQVSAWKNALFNQRLAPVTINSKLAALNGLFRMLGWHDCHSSYLKVQRRLFRDASRELSREEYEQLVQTAYAGHKRGLALVMETICASGIRVSELRYITVEAVQCGKAEIMLKGKVRVILLPQKLCKKLLAFAKKEKITSGEIFLTTGGKSLSRKQIWADMKALAKRAGIDVRKVFPHNLRHLFATVFYTACKDIVRLADVLGHSSVETTRIYLLTSDAEHRQQLERLRLVT